MGFKTRRKEMKKIVCAAMAVLLLAGVAYAAEKFAYVELGRIFKEYNKTKDYDKVLGDKENVYETEREKKVAEVKQMQDKMNLLSDKEKESKRIDLEAKVKAFQELDRQKLTDLRKESDEKRVEILKDIETTIKQYAQKEGYTLIFNEVGVTYNIKALEITDKILEILNSGYKKQ
jgi:outer membrane protein